MLRQSGKDQKSPPTSAVGACAYALYSYSKWVQITCSDYARFDRADRFEPPVNEEDEGQYDTSSEYPSGDLERDGWFDLPTPAIEKQEVRSGKSVDPIYRD